MKEYKLGELEDLTNVQLVKLIRKCKDKMEEIKHLSHDNVDSPSKQDENIKLLNKQKLYRNQLLKIDAFYKWKNFQDNSVNYYFSEDELNRVRLKFDRLKKLERIIGD